MNQIKFFATFLMLLIAFNVNAQIIKLTKDASLVIEGAVLSKNAFWNEERTRIYTDNKILVKSVFKGIPSDSILSVLTVGGEVDEFFQFQTHTIELQPNQHGYFFLIHDKNNKLKLINDVHGFCIENADLNPKIYAFGKKYSKRLFEEEIIKQTLFPKMSFRESLHFSESTLLSDRDTCDILPSSRNLKTIEFSFDSIRYTENYTHIEFVVMAKVNTPGLKFGKGDFFIQYSEEFGSDVVANESVEITKGVILQNSIYSVAYQDTTSQSISISANSGFVINDVPYTFSASAESLFRVKLQITDFTQIGNISFDDIDISGRVYYWCQGRYELFDEVILDEPISSTESQPGSAIGITYTFENASVNFDQTKFNVELFAQATSNSYYSDGFIYVNYNELGFGQSVVSNSNFTFEAGSFIGNSNVYTPFIYDTDNNTLLILIFAQDGTNQSNLSLLSTTPQKLGKLTFDILDCDKNKGLSFDLMAMQSAGTVHYTGNMPIPWEIYDPIIADDEENGKICGCSTPVITGFTPDNIPAGNGNVLTITGENFGNHSSTSSNVWFKNGDDGGSTWMRAHPVRDFLWDNVIHWSDTEIKVLVPSVDAEQSINKPAASGKFKVQNGCGEDESDEILTIPYAVMNRRSAGNARKIALKELNDGGICFTYDEDLPAWIRTEFENALNDWCPNTKISFFIDDSDLDLSQPSATDQINIIIEESVSSENGGAALLFTLRTELCGNGQQQGYYMTDMDIIIDPSWTGMGFPSDADKTNMRNKLKHELGHAHMINHAVIPSVFQPYNQSIVYWSFTATSSGGINVTIKSGDVEGANEVFQNSQQILSTSCGTPIQISDQCGAACSGTNSTIDNNFESDVYVFPNPTDGKVLIQSLNIDFESEGIFTVIDETGRIYFSKVVSDNTKIVEIELDLPSGVYFLRFQGQSGLFTKKIIVL